MIRPARPLLLLAALVAMTALVQPAVAESTPRLLERTQTTRRATPAISYVVGIGQEGTTENSEPAESWRREERWITDPMTGEEERIVLEGPAPDLGLKSFLIAIPEGHEAPSDAAAVRVTLHDAQTGELLDRLQVSDIEVKPAQVGLVRAAQVFYRLPETDRAIEARLTIDIPAAAGPQSRVRSSLPVPPSLATLFVNPEDAVVLKDIRHRGTTPQLLPPPGDIRIAFEASHRVYRVPIASLGIEPEEIENAQLIHHGVVIPFDVSGDDVIFYAERRVTDADTDDSVFVKIVDEDASPRFPTRPAFDTLEIPAEPTEVEVVRNRRFEWDFQYQPAVISLPLGSKFVFHRLRWPGNATTPHFGIYDIPINDVLTNTFFSLKVELHGQNQNNNFTPDHYADISFAGVDLPRTNWEGRTKHTANFNFTLPELPAGPVETLSFSHFVASNSPVTSAGNADEQTLDVVDITYLGLPRLEADGFGRVRLTPAGSPRRVTISGFPVGTVADDLLVLDVTDPNAPVHLTNPVVFPDSTGTVGVTFEAPASLSVYHVELMDALAAPTRTVEAEELPGVLSPDLVLRGIVVRDPIFAEEMKPWVDHRGPGILEMDPQAAYNVFNGGQASPESLRDAIRSLIESAVEAEPVPFVLLVGHGSFDRKNRLGFKDAPWIPAFLDTSVVFNYDPVTMVGTTIENAVDLDYGFLFGEDTLIDVQLTRWPAKTPADVQTVVARSLAHDNLAKALTRADRPIVFLADNEAAFINDQSIWDSIWSSNGFASLLMTRGQPVAELDGLINTPAIRKSLDRKDVQGDPLGASFFFYTGHGNFDRWAGTMAASFDTSTNPISNANIATFETSNQWPVAATFTCLNGNYATPGQTRLAMSEAWLFASDFGATANIAPSSVDFYNEQRLLQGAYLAQLGKADPGERAATIGQMSHRATVQYATQHPTLLKTLREYIVFGDPLALTTVVPQEAELAVTLESSAEEVSDGEPFTLTLTIENIGADEARGAVVEVNAPTGIELIEAVSPWGVFTDHGDRWEVALGTLAPGQTATIDLTVMTNPTAESPVEFTGTGQSITTQDVEPASDTATVIIIRDSAQVDHVAIF
jgi:hypothetical protein